MKRLRYLVVATAALALAYLAWTFVSRAVSTGRWARKNQPVEARGAEFARLYGGSDVKILQFYARDGSIVGGTKAVICYGVLNAKGVRIEPRLEGVSPSLNRCVEVSVEKETRYTLTAEGLDGRT